MKDESEVDAIRQRYARRSATDVDKRYNPLDPSVYMALQERERVLIRRILDPFLRPLHDRKLIEVGCGNGANLLHLARLGFRPENLVANEIIPERIEAARRLLPSAVEILPGDASQIDRPDVYDAALLSTVFTSILDDQFQQKLADTVWRMIKPGGGIIWYDFVYNNPRNPDVRGVNLARIQALFPAANIRSYRVTLTPPIARRVTAIHPGLYSLFNSIPLLRSHLLCWIAKPR